MNKLVTHRPERHLRNAILSLLRAHGIAAWPTGVGAFPASYQGKRRFVRMGTKGMSDIIGVVPVPIMVPASPTDGALKQPPGRDQNGRYILGRLLAVEVKSPTGKVRPEQTAFLAEVVRHGGIAFVARSVEEVSAKLNLGGRG